MAKLFETCIMGANDDLMVKQLISTVFWIQMIMEQKCPKPAIVIYRLFQKSFRNISLNLISSKRQLENFCSNKTWNYSANKDLASHSNINKKLLKLEGQSFYVIIEMLRT